MEAPGLDLVPLRPRRILSDEVAAAVRDLLMGQTLRPGQSLTIDRLATALGVSHTPVREALARLESEGLVVKRPQRGYFASELLSASEVDDLFEFRLLLEPWAAGRVAETAPANRVTELRAELARFTDAIGSETDAAYRLVCEHDIQFHGLLMNLSGSPQVAQAFARTHCHLHLLRLQSLTPKMQVTGQEHEAIIAAIENGDRRAAGKAMRAHLAASRRRAKALCGVAAE